MGRERTFGESKEEKFEVGKPRKKKTSGAKKMRRMEIEREEEEDRNYGEEEDESRESFWDEVADSITVIQTWDYC